MDGHDERAFEYRQKAEELRGMLEDMTDPETRAVLERIAVSYDQLADMRENIAKGEKDWAGQKIPS